MLPPILVSFYLLWLHSAFHISCGITKIDHEVSLHSLPSQELLPEEHSVPSEKEEGMQSPKEVHNRILPEGQSVISEEDLKDLPQEGHTNGARVDESSLPSPPSPKLIPEEHSVLAGREEEKEFPQKVHQNKASVVTQPTYKFLLNKPKASTLSHLQPIGRGDTFLRYCELSQVILEGKTKSPAIIKLAKFISKCVLTQLKRSSWPPLRLANLAENLKFVSVPVDFYGSVEKKHLDEIVETSMRLLNNPELATKSRYWLLGLLDSAQKTYPNIVSIPTFRDQDQLSRDELELSLVRSMS